MTTCIPNYLKNYAFQVKKATLSAFLIGACCLALIADVKGAGFTLLICLWLRANKNYETFISGQSSIKKILCKGFSFNVLIFGTVGIVFSSVITLSLPYLCSLIFPDSRELFVAQDPFNIKHSWVDAIDLVIFTPIAEELFFRLILLQVLTKRVGIRYAVLVSSFLFGIFHQEFIGSTIFGVFMAVVFFRSKNILMPILFHVFNNGIALTFHIIEQIKLF